MALKQGVQDGISAHFEGDLVIEANLVQTLWSNYGGIWRIRLRSGLSVIAKVIESATQSNHPRGWHTDAGHQRKVRSYQVERNWYRQHASRVAKQCRLPAFLGEFEVGADHIILLEDLDTAGYARRRQALTYKEMKPCIEWLARFHAFFVENVPADLWEVGTYWHLETRSEEFGKMSDSPLKEAAKQIDLQLKSGFQTLVHGDAKLANICFHTSASEVAFVDFQYVGKGCGMKDLAYFVGSCLDEDQSAQHDQAILAIYFDQLKESLKVLGKSVDTDLLEKQWRAQYPMAWADFERFLQGWSPGHWKSNGYTQRMVEKALNQL